MCIKLPGMRDMCYWVNKKDNGKIAKAIEASSGDVSKLPAKPAGKKAKKQQDISGFYVVKKWSLHC